MKKQRKIICILVVLTLTLYLSACSLTLEKENQSINSTSEKSTEIVIAPEKGTIETTPGYFSTELENPEWLYCWGSCEIIGDTFYIVAYLKNGGLAVASYDTINEIWQRYDLKLDSAYYPSVERFSATDNSLWVLLREHITEEEICKQDYSRKLDYYLLYMDLSTGNQTYSHVDFWNEGSPYLMSLIALDSNRALVGNGEKTFLLDSQACVIGMPELNVQGEGLHARVNDNLYIQTEKGLAELNIETLQFGKPIEEIYDQPIYYSSLGNFLTIEDSVLYSVNPESGEKAEIFSWMDVALSYNRLYGWNGLENSNGDFFHLTDRLTKISKGEIPKKQTLTLACLGNASDEMYEFSNCSYTCTPSMMDAIIRFNNSDPEFRIEVKPYIYHDDAERNKILIDIATRDNIDVLDTSLLPEGAVDKQMLVDLLPYIDADDSISRDDFIPTLLNGMIKNGGLYEYVNKYTILTMITHPSFAVDEEWTVDKIEGLMTQYSEMRIPANQDQLVTIFSWAASAEFMDWTNMTCNFDDPDFVSWLTLLKDLLSDASERDSEIFLFNIFYDFARRVGFDSRKSLKGEYVPVGFPNSEGTGSYFMKPGISGSVGSTGYLYDGSITLGCVTSLGIMSSSKNHDGAWRFIRTFMLGEEEPALNKGIPVLKENFERAIDVELRKNEGENREFEAFNENDAKYLRELVYNTSQIVCSDMPVMDVLKTAINSYLGGQGTAQEIAQQIQSRISLYMAEKA